MGQDYRVALIAIASNEGAYLAQFVFHHLRMGFCPITLITNNSEDDTSAMAARMAEQLPDVYHLDGDPLREGKNGSNQFQNRAYRKALAWLAEYGITPDYVMLLDIDEYWVPLDDSSSVSAYIQKCDSPDAMLFNWVAPYCDTNIFTQVLQPDFVGVPQSNIKSLWRYGLTIRGLNAHIIYSPDLKTQYVASGADLFTNSCRTVTHPDHPGDAMIVHQMYRSMTEYVALLSRGRPSFDVLFKTNRWGYRHALSDIRAVHFGLPETLFMPWQSEFPTWIDSLGLVEMLFASRLKLVERAARGLELYVSLSEEEREPYAEAFRFVDFDAVRAEITELLSDPAKRITLIP